MAFAAYASLAAGQVLQGYQQKKQADYQARLYEVEAQNIQYSQDIEARKYDRLRNRYQGTFMARLAKSGIDLSGSPAAVLADSLTQIEMDKQIGLYNLELQRSSALSTASAYKTMGKQAVLKGWGNAFQTMMLYGADKLNTMMPTTSGSGARSGAGSASAYGSTYYSPMTASYRGGYR